MIRLHRTLTPALVAVVAAALSFAAVNASAQVVIASPPGIERPPFQFDQETNDFLDEVQIGCINYLVNEVDPVTLMAYDRTGLPVISVAGVGFQLTALCIADARGWLPQGTAAARAFVIVNALKSNPENRERGLFYHYLDPGTAGRSQAGYEDLVSTVDTALLFAGLLTASSYFGGPVAAIADELVLEADWQSFVLNDPSYGNVNGFISLGWEDPGPGQPWEAGLLPFAWADAGDEQRLTTFVARLPKDPAHRVAPEVYYSMRRTLGTIPDGTRVVWFPWSGALFTAFFSHCWMDYASRGPDNPARFGIENRPAPPPESTRQPARSAGHRPQHLGPERQRRRDGLPRAGRLPDAQPAAARHARRRPPHAPARGRLGRRHARAVLRGQHDHVRAATRG